MAWTQVLAANALATGAREVVKVGDRQKIGRAHV